MKYSKYFDHHSDDYNPLAGYRGIDPNDYAFEEAMLKAEKD